MTWTFRCEVLNWATAFTSQVLLVWVMVCHIVICTGVRALASADRPQADGTTLVDGGAGAAPAVPDAVPRAPRAAVTMSAVAIVCFFMTVLLARFIP